MSAAVSNCSETLSDIPLLRSQTVEIFNTLKNSEHFLMLYRDLESSPVMGMYEKSNYFQVFLNALSAGDNSALQKRFSEITTLFSGESTDEFDSFMYSFMTLFLSFFHQIPLSFRTVRPCSPDKGEAASRNIPQYYQTSMPVFSLSAPGSPSGTALLQLHRPTDS